MNEKYRGRGNDIGQMGQGRKGRAREMSKYKNKQGSQGYWEKVEIVQQFGIESINKIFPALGTSVPLDPDLVRVLGPDSDLDSGSGSEYTGLVGCGPGPGLVPGPGLELGPWIKVSPPLVEPFVGGQDSDLDTCHGDGPGSGSGGAI
jgi:hypothetical protein